MAITRRKYTKGGLTVVWQPELCIHAAICINGLPTVFDVDSRPWVNMEGADVELIAAQVRQCPSGALSLEGDDPA